MQKPIFTIAAAAITLAAVTASPAQARFLQTDPVGYEGGHNLYAYAMNDPVNFIDFTGNAPNRRGATDYEEVATRIDQNGFSAVSGNATNAARYVYTETYGWVDLRHFGTAAEMVIGGTPGPVVETMGFGVEVQQWASEWGNDYRSGFSPEDLPSNSAGVSFGEYVLENEGSGLTRGQLFSGWATANGSPQVGSREYRGAVSALPLNDPSNRGGAGRGSNASSGPNGVSSSSSTSNRTGISQRDAICTGSTGTSATSC